jgi:ABC-2 type transport system permease protein
VDNAPVVIWDQSETTQSREFISHFKGSNYFSVKKYITSYSQIDKAINSRDALAAVVIPRDFAQQLQAGRNTPVQLIVDGSDSNTATIVLGYVRTITQDYSSQILLEQLDQLTGREVTQPVDFRPRVWFNPDMESKNYIIPGLIAVIMMVIAALLTSLTVAREWERGSMEQLISTPIKGHELITGKLLPYFIIGLFDVLLAVLMGEFLFKVPLRGSVVLLFIMASIFLAGALSLGIVISVVTKSQLLASQLAMVLTFLPSFLLSGFMYAITNMPKPIQVITFAIPARYFVVLLKAIYLKGVGLEIVAGQAILLTVFGVVTVTVANIKFRKKLE